LRGELDATYVVCFLLGVALAAWPAYI
jgi:hypothetical protein